MLPQRLPQQRLSEHPRVTCRSTYSRLVNAHDSLQGDAMTDRLGDTWTTREYPLLLEAARRLNDGETNLYVDQLATQIGMDPDQAQMAVAGLADDGYVVGVTVEEINGPVVITSITPKARREVGLWPSTEVGVDRLVQALDALIDQAKDPDERTRWQKLRGHVTENSAQIGWSLVTAILTGQLPGQ